MRRRPLKQPSLLATTLAVLAFACNSGSGQGPSAVGLTVSPDSLDFPSTLLGDSVQRALLMRNDGSDAVSVELSVRGANEGDFSVGDQRRVAIAAGDSVEVAVTYRPGSVGEHWADLRYVARGAAATLPLHGTAVLSKQTQQQLVVSPEQISVPATVGGEATIAALTLENAGDTAIRFGAYEQGSWTARMPKVVSDSPDSFDLQFDEQELLAGLKPGATARLWLQVRTVMGVAQSATVEIYSSDSVHPTLAVLVDVAAAGLPCKPSVAPARLEEEIVEVEPGQTLTFFVGLQNDASAEEACQVEFIGWSGPAGVTLEAVQPASIAPGSSMTVAVRFTPSGAGLTEGSVDFRIANAQAPIELPVSLNVESFQPCLDMPSDVFFDVAIGCTKTQTVTITNRCRTSMVSIDEIAFEPATSNFALVDLPQMPKTLDHGATVDFEVRFEPVDLGQIWGSISIHRGNGWRSLIWCSGTGLPPADQCD